MSREILVVERTHLFSTHSFDGFLPLAAHDYLHLIQACRTYKERTDALEHDVRYIQPIPYVWLINPVKKQAFLYKRAISANAEYRETRLLHKLSGGVGGHIDHESPEPHDPLMTTAERELREEVVLKQYPSIRFLGCLYSNIDLFNQVHFGVMGVAETSESPQPADGMQEGAFYSTEEIDALMVNPAYDIENWTRISWPVIKQLLI